MTSKINIYFLLLTVVLCSCKQTTNKKATSDRKVAFNKNWEFHLEDSLETDQVAYTWKKLNLPHDWSIEGKFNKNHPATYGGGALPGGIGWYKKTFKIDEEDQGKVFYIHFDGVYMNSEVWINDHYLGKRPNGYIGFRYDLTPHLNFGEKENEIKVKVDNSQQPNSRWYSGSGIYRNTWLVKTNKLHINNWGTYVATSKVSKKSATINIETTIKNKYKEAKQVRLNSAIFLKDKKIAESINYMDVNSGSDFTFEEEIETEEPVLWTLEAPSQYTLLSTVYIDDELVDEYKTTFGIRTFNFDVDKGFILNDKSVKIKGVCNHHDLGALGTAVNTRALERQLEIMKEAGINGIRTAHNPPAPELLDLCDRMGFIVMDESFDMWKKNKTANDYGLNWDEWHKKDLEDFIKRDRNHPSIFVWSIGNEIIEQWDSTGVEITKNLAKIVRSLDTTRPITTANNPPSLTNSLNASGALDLVGYNYAHTSYEKHKEIFPNLPFIATETTSALATRGYYDQKSDTLKKWPVRWDLLFTGGNPENTVSSYDQVSAPWGSTHEETWKIIKRNPNLSGMYIWTGFDYLGEPTPYAWPSRSSYFGIIDLAGFPKDAYYMYQSEWTDTPVLHVFPHWNWEEGKEIDIWAYYSQADEVELFLNEESLGVKKKEGDDLHIMWRVPFKSGTLKAVSRKNGKEVLVKEIKTANEASQIVLQADRNEIKADTNDLSFITVTVLDEYGTLVPNATNNIQFTVEGPGKIIGVDNGDPTSHTSFKASNRNAFYGKCLVIVQGLDKKGVIKLSAKSEELKGTKINIIVN